MEEIVKSKQRVADHGEVLTGKREVNAMLDLVKQETERIESRFLEVIGKPSIIRDKDLWLCICRIFHETYAVIKRNERYYPNIPFLLYAGTGFQEGPWRYYRALPNACSRSAMMSSVSSSPTASLKRVSMIPSS